MTIDRMDIGRLGVWSMAFKDASPQALDATGELHDLGFPTMWMPGLDGRGALNALDAMLTAAPRATVALGVLSIWAQEASELGDGIRALDERHGARSLIGLGVSNSHSAAAAGKAFGTPLNAMGHYLDDLAARAHPIHESRLLLGALGPRMVDLAVRRTVGWHPFLVTPEYTARERGRVGRAPLVAPHLAVVLERDPRLARAAARAGVGAFIGFPSYRANLTRLGFTDDDLTPGGSDRLIDALVAWGDLDQVAKRIRAHLDAGADHVALHVLGTERSGEGVKGPVRLPRREWRELAGLLPSF